MSTRKIGKYDVIERLGRGGMAEVFRAYQSSLDRYVAIKVLHAFLADDPEFKSRFEREAQNVAKLRHPNIVQVYDFEYDPAGESYYMVMELIDGPTLKDRINSLAEQDRLLEVVDVVRIVREAAGALAYAHSRSMIHRDVKPANLMIDHDERIVLTDFGIAKIVTGAQFTATGGMVGTPAYMAPEQGLGEAGDERSDLYSLGIILFQLLSGHLPYDAETPLATILRHLNTPTPSVRQFNPNVSESVDRIVQKAIAKEAVDRYQTANEFIEDLQRFDRELHGGPPAEITVNQPAASASDSGTITAVPSPLKPAETDEPHDTLPLPKTEPTATIRSRPRQRSYAGLIVSLLLLVGAGAVAVATGALPVPGLFGTATQTAGVTQAVAAVTETPAAPTLTDAVVESATTEPTTAVAVEATEKPTRTPFRTPTATPTPTVTVTPSPSPTPATPVAVMRQSIVVRQGPGLQYARLANAASGDSLVIVGRSEDNLWFRVLTAGGLPGWIPVTVVDAFGNLARLPVVAAPTLTPTFTPSFTPSRTPTATATPTATIDIAQTVAALTLAATEQQATLDACQFDYAVRIQSEYDKTNEGIDFVKANTEYTLEITFVNMGTCAWGPNTALVFIEGDNLDAGRVIFFRENEQVVEPGGEAILDFVGRTPARFGLKTGTWELRTPGQIPIGQPIVIQVQIFE
ncbi:MAG: protein kinase [Anaerolineae bacterium]|nr:protein kinase [Anaerolineae bacterium]